jgi:hypothetical protein
MSKLTDTQLVILSAGSRRVDHGVDLPTNVTDEAVRKPVDELIRAGMLEEVRAKGSLLAWRRHAEAGPMALRITKQGLEAIGVKDDSPGALTRTSVNAAPAHKVKAPATRTVATHERSSVAARTPRGKHQPGKAKANKTLARGRRWSHEWWRCPWGGGPGSAPADARGAPAAEAIGGQLVGMVAQQGGNFRLYGLRQQCACAVALDLGQRIRKSSWLR